MKKTDSWVILLVILAITLHLSVLIVGIRIHLLPYFTPILNLVSGLLLLLYWLQKEIRIKIHTIELREMIVLSLETIYLKTG